MYVPFVNSSFITTHVPKLSSTGSKSGPDSRRWRQLTWIVDIGEAFASKVDYLDPDCSTWLMDALAGQAHIGLVPAMRLPCRILRTPRTPFDFPNSCLVTVHVYDRTMALETKEFPYLHYG